MGEFRCNQRQKVMTGMTARACSLGERLILGVRHSPYIQFNPFYSWRQNVSHLGSASVGTGHEEAQCRNEEEAIHFSHRSSKGDGELPRGRGAGFEGTVALQACLSNGRIPQTVLCSCFKNCPRLCRLLSYFRWGLRSREVLRTSRLATWHFKLRSSIY